MLPANNGFEILYCPLRRRGKRTAKRTTSNERIIEEEQDHHPIAHSIEAIRAEKKRDC